MARDRPNVLLVVFDTARADAFEPGPANRTPTVAELGRRGSAQPLAIAPSNWTLPSHASMFTGLLPGGLGLARSLPAGTGAGMRSREILEANRHRNLAEVLRTSGYATCAVSSNPWIHPVNGFATGFEVFETVHGPERRQWQGGLRSRAAWLRDAWRSEADNGGDAAEAVVDGWLRDQASDDRPFFWFVNLMECHSPYLPPRPFNDLPGWQRVLAARDAARFQTPGGFYRVSAGELDLPASSARRMQHLYHCAIGRLDTWLADLLEKLERRGLLADTVVAVTSDHGENLGEADLLGHVLSLDDRLIRVPLVVAGPGAPEERDLVSLTALPALLADAIGLDDHPWHAERTTVAVSQAAGQVLATEQEALARAWGMSEAGLALVSRSLSCATDGTWKLVREADDPATDRFVDLVHDPLEVARASEATVPADVRARLRTALDDADREALGEPPTDAASPSAAPAGSDDETAELEARMRALGYL